MKSADIRQAFLSYFEKAGHRVLPSSSLVPGNDPTLLFTNAGMVQFKEVFLGQAQPVHSRVATSQCCVRAGGKHNDLENVGHTARHHTFFEMLGNFSFGDYFKREAIAFAWQFLTEELGVPTEKLWVTVHDSDDEAEKIWLEDIGVDKSRVIRCGDADNFWMMGDVGPCGPCTEIFYDHGESVAGGLPGSPDADGDRYVEIWNLVFMQYVRDKAGKMMPLPKPSVDTGMGLERISAVMQGVHSNYGIDLFQALIKAAADILNVNDLNEVALNVIADHIRSASFLILDGVIPGNEGRNYVLRRILRRAIRHGYQLGMHTPFMFKLVKPLLEQMGEAYPALVESQTYIEKIIKKEEVQFLKTLERGLSILSDTIARITGDVIPGETVFKLYDTYGFPVDLTADIARDKSLIIDEAGFDKAMAAQKVKSKGAGQFSAQSMIQADLGVDAHTVFVGYECARIDDAKIVWLSDKDAAGFCQVILDKTPFYAEGGGQVGDHGQLRCGDAVLQVVNTKKKW